MEKNYVIFTEEMATTSKAKEILATAKELMEKGPDNYIGKIGLEEVLEELLKLTDADYIGLYSESHYSERYHCDIYTLNFAERADFTERAVVKDYSKIDDIAQFLCEKQNVDPEWQGGSFQIHSYFKRIKKKSRRIYSRNKHLINSCFSPSAYGGLYRGINILLSNPTLPYR